MGTVNYLQSHKLQEKLRSDRKSGKFSDTLLSLQHPPTYTLGKQRTYYNLLVPENDLKAMGAQLHYTQRGGDNVSQTRPSYTISHSLSSRYCGAHIYVEKFESTMIELASLYGLEARPGEKGETGVWVGDRKTGAIGARISCGITSHGLAFNIDPDLSFFEHIVPCGIVGKGVTSLRRELGVEMPTEEVIREQLISCPFIDSS